MKTTQTNFENSYSRAKERVEKLREFYKHATIYGIFCFVFVWINITGGSSFPWAIFPIAGWGLGVLGHAADTFEWNPFFGKNWERRKIAELMKEESRQF